MDFESIKRLGLDHIGIDATTSFESFDPSTTNHTIFIHLLKLDEISCPLCGVVNDYVCTGSRSQILKYSSAVEDNISIKLYRRTFKCKSCGHNFKESNPFTEAKRSTSLHKDMKILEALKGLNLNYTSIAKRFNVSVTYVTNLFDKKVDLNRLPLPEVMCVDEVYSKRLSHHKYCFIIYSPYDRKIIDVVDSRRMNNLIDYFSRIPSAEKNNVKYFSMDLYDNYRDLAMKCFPKAIICADSFHVIKNLSQCFHRIRIRIMKKYGHLKDNNDNYYWLFKKYWKLLTKDSSKLSYKHFETRSNQWMTCREVIDYMLSIDSDLKLAYELLHEYRNFNEKATIDNAAEWLDEIILKFQAPHIPEYIPAWKLLLNWRNEIINSFNRHNGYRISNGPMERANLDIKTIFRLSFGSRNFPRMRNRIMYVMNSNSPILYHRKETTNKYRGKPRGKYKKHI